MKYKVGDKVRVKSLEWYNEHKNECGNVNLINSLSFTKPMSEFCGKEVEICNVHDGLEYYYISGDEIEFGWTDEMFEDVMEKKTPKTQEEVNKYLLDNPVKNPANLWDIEQVLQNDGLKLPEDVRVNSNGISGIAFTKWYETKQYPQNYIECFKILNLQPYNSPSAVGYMQNEFAALQKLFICRNAYWKIAGEEMGLGKSWEPDWTNDKQQKFYITYFNCQIELNFCATHSYAIGRHNHILAFPTEERRDAFFENFKELIETCKEFL